MKQITDFEFETTIASGRVLVDFYTTWCQPCNALAPILENLEATTNTVTFVKINIDEETLHASRNHVTSMPTLILFEDGYETKRYVGLMSAPTLKEWLGV